MPQTTPRDSLEDAKKRLRRFVGQGPIHGLGLRRSENAVCLYVHPKGNAITTSVLKEVRRAAAPYKVIVITEEAAQTTLE